MMKQEYKTGVKSLITDNRLESTLEYFLNDRLLQVIISNPVSKEGCMKVKVRPLLLRGALTFQAEEFVGKQAFHKNLSCEEAKNYIMDLLKDRFRQAQITSQLGSGTVSVSYTHLDVYKRQVHIRSG